MAKYRIWYKHDESLEPFYLEADKPETVAIILNTIWLYNAYQYKNGLIPDYLADSGVECFVNNEWVEPSDERWLSFFNWMAEEWADSFTSAEGR